MLKDLVKANRSYRGYDEGRCVTKEELLEMADCARLAASSVNRQPLQYYLAWEKDEVDKIQALTKWAKGLPELTLPHPHMCPTAFIVICQNTKRGESLARFQRDVGIAAQTILLAATEQGLGGCFIGNIRKEKLAAVLNLPEGYKVDLCIALGYPKEEVVLEDIAGDGDIHYYRDDNQVQHVPKKKLDDILI